MPSFNDILAYRKRVEAEQAGKHTLKLQADAEVARRAQRVLEHPGWNLFQAEIIKLQELADGNRQTALDALIRDEISPEGIWLAKVRYARADAGAQTLQAVLDLIPQMIEKGEAAVRELGS